MGTKVSDAIVGQLEDMILDGAFKPGDKLPPERELAQQLNVSRPSLREAIVVMETRGLLQVKRGGGTFLADISAHTITDPLVHLIKRRPNTTFDVVELRLALEEVAAYYAAGRATNADKDILRQRFEALEDSYDAEDIRQNADADVEFHMAIADASHNIALVHVMRGLFNLLRVSIFSNLQRIYMESGGKEVVRQQHQALVDAILSVDPEAARDAAHTHLSFVAFTLHEEIGDDVQTEQTQWRSRRKSKKTSKK
ncbi:MAG: FCD domain-containing protein [Rhodospirillales bacterium]|nr:FCD domain-containing protein [Rhodospirillales bacterium]